ncbi:MAG: hypothetical protein AAGF74_12375 [Pseudomonadota bacterium]
MADRDVSRAEVRRLFARERAALRQGNIGALAELARQKEEMLLRIGGGAIDPAVLQTIRTEARRNALIVRSVHGAIVGVRRRVRALLDGGATLGTYSADGISRALVREEGRVRRKA